MEAGSVVPPEECQSGKIKYVGEKSSGVISWFHIRIHNAGKVSKKLTLS
jgi:hypothetical protein